MIEEIILFAGVSFATGFSGAVVPGPMLTITISDSVKKGFITGPLVVLGHFIAELSLIIFLLAGFTWLIGSSKATMIIGTVGGLILIYMGYTTSKSSINLDNNALTGKFSNQKYGSILGGVMTSISNPYFFIWWVTIGWAFMFKGLELAGFIGLLAFLIGHWSADLSWFSLVSFFTSRGSEILTESHYKLIMKICGVFLAMLGVYFIISTQYVNLISLL